jgi:Cdc6-like AAA superfamily ATPase
MIKQSTQCRSLFLNLGASSADLSIDDISKALLGRSDVIGEVKKTLKRTSKKHKVHLIVVLDELDFLLTSTSKMKNSVLGEILSWASDPLYRLSIIGISNSVGDEIARRLHKNAKIGTELVFEPYGHEDLVGIINQRLGPDKTLAEDKAVIYAAKKVAAINGDARRILDLVSDALKQSKSFQSKEMLSSKNVDRPVLKMVHVMMAVKNDKGIVSYVDRINCLPPKAKAVLCVASAIHRQRKTWKNIKLSKLRDICMEVTNRGLIDEEMNTERFRELVETLEDAGLFASGGVDEFTSRDDGCDNFSGRTIRVGASLDDVEVALNQSLLKCSDGEMDPNAKFKDIIDKFCERNYAEKL